MILSTIGKAGDWEDIQLVRKSDTVMNLAEWIRKETKVEGPSGFAVWGGSLQMGVGKTGPAHTLA